jgi:hypothetical protein
LAGIGTLDFPGCQRVIEPVSRLFFINPSTKSERTPQIKAGALSNQNFLIRNMENYFFAFLKNE